MKTTIRTSLLFVFAFLLSFLMPSCSPISMGYYYQQQSDADEDGGKSEEDDWDDDIEEEEPPAGSISSFAVIRPDGEIDEELLSDYPDELAAINERLPDTSDFSSASIMVNDRIVSSFNDENVPSMHFEDGSWDAGTGERSAERHEFLYHGANSSAQGNTISNMDYYAYRGLNPFFSADSSYNTAGFGNGDETRMDRFVFYRFTGKAVIVELDNYLVAVDTYTRLFYAFGVPTDTDSLLGQEVPTKWGSVEANCTDPEGKARRFYEYDPAGYVDDEGNFINADWYEENLASGTYDPLYTGLSPYAVAIGETLAVTPLITATTLEEDGILKDETGYYTEIGIQPQAVDLTYTLFRRDDSGDEWFAVAGDIAVAAGESAEVRDYGGLYLTGYPQYKAEALSSTGDSAGESAAVEGSRMLSNEEVLLGAMNSIRLSFGELWYPTANANGSLKKGTFNDADGFYHHGIDYTDFFLWANYRRYQSYVGFHNTLFTLDGTFMKDEGDGFYGLDINGIWTHEGSSWPDDGDFLPRTDELTVTFAGREFSIRFNEVKIDNNDGNEPDWDSGTLIVQSEDGTDEFDKNSGFPFVLFMDDEAFTEATK